MANKKKIIVLVVGLVALAAVGYGVKSWQDARATKPSIAWGSVDAREVTLAFEGAGRIATLMKEEGEKVQKGDVLGRLDTRALEIERQRAQAEFDALDAKWHLAEAGFRDEEVAAAKAELEAIESELVLARKIEARQEKLYASQATSVQNLEEVRWRRVGLEKRRASALALYNLKKAGLRPDEIRQAKAARDAGAAVLASLNYQIETAAVLTSPVNGVIRTRLAEPGDMTSAQRAVYHVSIMDPKWVRAFVSETQLAYVKEGAEALVTTDTTPPIKARVGYISSEAEFTPKTVATQALRTALVYEVRLNLDDKENALRLGQPVTVDFAPNVTR